MYYVLSYTQSEDACVKLAAVTLACLLVGLIGFGMLYFLQKLLIVLLVFLNPNVQPNFISLVGRIYLGMHSLIDIIGGLAIGLVILAMWLTVNEYVDGFIVSGQNGK